MNDETTGQWPSYGPEEIEAVSRVLRSGKVNYWTGQEGKLFEQEFADFAQTKHAVAVANGTLALDLALHGLGIGANNGGSSSDEVIVTPRSFIASASCVVNAGARPVFSDVDSQSQNITPDTVLPLLTPDTVAIICVHLAGWPCDMDGFKNLIKDRKINLIEDCAQAHGAKYKGLPVGGLGDVAAWSFCQDKIMTTGGEGGMVTCNDTALWKRMWAFKDHGKNWDTVHKKNHPEGFRWVHESFGSNFRLTEMQAAIGRIQLKNLTKQTQIRHRNVAKLTGVLQPLVKQGWLRIPEISRENCNNVPPKCSEHAFYKFYAFVQPQNLPAHLSRDALIKFFNEAGISCAQGSCSEIYLEKAFDMTEFRPHCPLPIARELGATSIMFTVHPGMEIGPITLPN